MLALLHAACDYSHRSFVASDKWQSFCGCSLVVLPSLLVLPCSISLVAAVLQYCHLCKATTFTTQLTSSLWLQSFICRHTPEGLHHNVDSHGSCLPQSSVVHVKDSVAKLAGLLPPGLVQSSEVT